MASDISEKLKACNSLTRYAREILGKKSSGSSAEEQSQNSSILLTFKIKWGINWGINRYKP